MNERFLSSGVSLHSLATSIYWCSILLYARVRTERKCFSSPDALKVLQETYSSFAADLKLEELAWKDVEKANEGLGTLLCKDQDAGWKRPAGARRHSDPLRTLQRGDGHQGRTAGGGSNGGRGEDHGMCAMASKKKRAVGVRSAQRPWITSRCRAGVTQVSPRSRRICRKFWGRLLNQLPLRINRSPPHGHPGFDVLGRFPRGRRRVLCSFFRPQRCVWATRPGVSSGAFENVARRLQKYKQIRAHGARDVTARIMRAGGRHTRGAQTLRGLQDATWMVEHHYGHQHLSGSTRTGMKTGRTKHPRCSVGFRFDVTNGSFCSFVPSIRVGGFPFRAGRGTLITKASFS